MFMGANLPFGGLAIVLMGDLLQITPVRSGPPLYETNSPLFRLFRYFQLTKQHRSEDIVHTANIMVQRNTDSTHPFLDVNWAIYQRLSMEDVNNDFSNAIHICSTNAERSILNRTLAEHYGHRNSKLVLRWRLRIPAWAEDIGRDLWEILENREEFYGLFVEGAPAMLTKTFSTRAKICNGLSCDLVSVGYYEPERQSEYLHAVTHANSTVVNVPIPDYIVVRLKDGPWDGTLLPVTLDDDRELTILKRNFTAVCHGVDIALAITFHKCVGQTLEYVVLHLSPSPVLSTPCVHVGMSRVKARTRLRIFPIASIQHILEKRWSPMLASFMKNVKFSV